MGTRTRHDQEDRAVGVQQPARRRHHRHGHRRRRRGDQGAAVGRRRARCSSAAGSAWPSASTRRTSRPMGRTAYGVRGIQLREGDEVVAMEVVKPGGTLLTVTQKGYAKRTELEEYRVQSRGGLGLKNLEITDKNGNVVGIAQVHENEELLVITQQGKILRTPTARHPHHRPRDPGRPRHRSRRRRHRRLRGPCRTGRRRVVFLSLPAALPVGGGSRNGTQHLPGQRGDWPRRGTARAPRHRLFAAARAAVPDPVLPRRPRARQQHHLDDVGRRVRSARTGRGLELRDHQRQRGTAHAVRLSSR